MRVNLRSSLPDSQIQVTPDMTVTGGTCAPNSTATIGTYVVFNAAVWVGSPVRQLPAGCAVLEQSRRSF